MRLARYAELRPGVYALLAQGEHLPVEGDGVEHHAVTDDIERAGLKYPAGNGVQDETLPTELEGVPRIGPALKACHDVIAGCQGIDHFPLALISPLQTEEHV